MSLSPFTSSWEFRREPDGDYAPVELPHDAMLGEGRSPRSPAGFHGSFFLGGAYRYRTTWTAPKELRGKQVSLVFEAVYRRSAVLVNGHHIGGAIGGYTTYEVRIDEKLDLGSPNLIEVLVDNAELPSTRWYSGSGIYRPVWLKVKNPVHLVPDGVRLRALETADVTRAEVGVEVANPDDERLEVAVTLVKDGREVARASAADLSATASLALTVPSAQLWSAEHPHRYRLDVVVTCGRVGYVRGVETGRSSLRSAGPARLRLTAESTRLAANGQDLAYLQVSLADEHDVVEMLDDDLVQITVTGPASLAGFGSASPATEERLDDEVHTTYRGRALAVARSGTAAGTIHVEATSQKHGNARLELQQA